MAEMKPGRRRVKFGEVVRLVSDRCDPVSVGIEHFVGLEHLEPGDLRIRSWGDVAEGTTFTNRFRPGQVLFGKRRAYQRKIAVADFDGVCSGDIYVLESADPALLLPELLPFICQTDAFFEHAVGTSAGSLSPRTNWASLAEYEFALPPLEEQRQIRTAFGAMQSTHDALSELITATTVQRLSLARWLFSRNDVALRRLSDFVNGSAYGPRFPGSHYAPDGNAYTVRTTDFSADGELDFTTVPAARIEPSVAEQHRLLDGDFLLSRSGEYAGMVRVFDSSKAPPKSFIPAAFLIRFRLDQSRLLPKYLFEYCESPKGNASVRGMAQGSAQPNISGSAFLELPVPILPIGEQRRVCALLADARAAERLMGERRLSYERFKDSALKHLLQGGEA
jgi:type I restriction enzyme S subunit